MISCFFLIAVAQVLAIIAFIKVGWGLAIFPEMFAVLCILNIPYAFFRRCPVCGKRSLTLEIDNFDSATDIGVCRNCESHISIERKGLSRYIYYVENKHGQKERVVPIWRTFKRRKNCETPEIPKYKKNDEVSKRRKSCKTSEYVKSYDTSNYRKA